MTAPLATALLLGLMSSFHCVGMCGSIIGTLTLSLDPSIRSRRTTLLPYVLSYNLGRILSYTVAGALAGTIGYAVRMPFEEQGYRFLQILSAVVMASAGLYLAGGFSKFVYIERLGGVIWRRLEPLGRRLLPVRNLGQAFLFGMVWGWLPCSLVYMTLALAATAGTPPGGALVMTAFGIGTVPAVAGVGIMTRWLVRLARDRFRSLVGGVMLLLAIFSAFPGVVQELLAWLWGVRPWWEKLLKP